MIKRFSFVEKTTGYYVYNEVEVEVNGKMQMIRENFTETSLLCFIYDSELEALLTIIPTNILAVYIEMLKKEYQSLDSDFSKVCIYATAVIKNETVKSLEDETLEFSELIKTMGIRSTSQIKETKIMIF